MLGVQKLITKSYYERTKVTLIHWRTKELVGETGILPSVNVRLPCGKEDILEDIKEAEHEGVFSCKRRIWDNKNLEEK